MIHGPGCPVLRQRPLEQVDKALAIAARPDVIFTSYGGHAAGAGLDDRPAGAQGQGGGRPDRVTRHSMRSRSPSPIRTGRSSSSRWASRRPRPRTPWRSPRRPAAGDRQLQRARCRTCWFHRRSSRCSSRPSTRSSRSWAAGHVCAVMGWTEYEPIAAKVPRPESWSRASRPLDLLEGISHGDPAAGGGSPRGGEPVRSRGCAGRVCHPPSGRSSRSFEVGARSGAGSERSPLRANRLRGKYTRFDAELRFSVGDIHTQEHPGLHRRAILTGEQTPLD